MFYYSNIYVKFIILPFSNVHFSGVRDGHAIVCPSPPIHLQNFVITPK